MKRYDYYSFPDESGIEEDDNGEYVKYSDHLEQMRIREVNLDRMQDVIDELRSRYEKLQEVVNKITHDSETGHIEWKGDK